MLNLTIPQILILEANLKKILKAESGEDKEMNTDSMANRTSFAATLKMLQERTGHDKFTYAEVMNVADTLKKYGAK